MQFSSCSQSFIMTFTLVLCWALLVVLISLVAKYRRRSRLPGPPGLPFFGHVFHMLATSKDVMSIFKKWYDNYGDICEVDILGTVYVLVAKPEVIELVLTSSKHITKGHIEYSFIKHVIGDGLVISDGYKWRSRRKLLTPCFHFKILGKYLEGVCRNAEVFVSSLIDTRGKPTDIQEFINLLALKIVCESAMGVELNPEDKQQDEYISAMNACADSIVHRGLRFWLYPDFTYHLSNAGKLFFQSVSIVHKFAEQVIRQRKESFQSEKNMSLSSDATKNVQRKAFLDTLLELDRKNPGLLTEEDIKDEVNTFMAAGHHTLTSTLLFSHFILANHPEVQEKAYCEQIAIFGNDKRMPTAEDLHKMTFLEMVIKETLRLYPSVPFYSRSLMEDLQMDENTVIPAGHTLVILNYFVHRSSRYWISPEEFIPERFAPGTERHPFSFIPFSAGPRNCIGQKVAMMELKTILSTVVRRCRVEPVTTSIKLDYGITLKPAEPIIVKVFPRDEAQR